MRRKGILFRVPIIRGLHGAFSKASGLLAGFREQAAEHWMRETTRVHVYDYFSIQYQSNQVGGLLILGLGQLDYQIRNIPPAI